MIVDYDNQEIISTHSLTRRLTTLRHSTTPTRTNFNSQPHKEADFGSPSALIYTLYFNSQPHKEADVSQHTRCFGIWTFQLTASQGG